jgi:hypothetical protein
MRKWANILLGIWLILTGLVHLGGVSFAKSGVILPIIGILVGILFFIADRSEKLVAQIGSVLLGAWLVAGGLVSLFHIHFAGSSAIIAVLAMAAGVVVMITQR